MKNLFTLWICLLLAFPVWGEEVVSRVNVSEKLQEWDTETILDSLDQEQLPKVVSSGLFGGANVSNFIIGRNGQSMSSYLRVGAEIGAFMDFRVTKHFFIRPELCFVAENNLFSAQDSSYGMWSFGAEVPIYFLGRWGNMQKGYLQAGGGIYTHFTFASNVAGTYRNRTLSEAEREKEVARYELQNDYASLLKLHQNHFGVCAMVLYELPQGVQFRLSYKVSLSDICTFYLNNKGEQIANAAIYPQRISFGIGYHFR